MPSSARVFQKLGSSVSSADDGAVPASHKKATATATVIDRNGRLRFEARNWPARAGRSVSTPEVNCFPFSKDPPQSADNCHVGSQSYSAIFRTIESVLGPRSF